MTTTVKRTPLYLWLKDELMAYIEEELRSGDLIPSEPEIEKKYQVSRITVRKAIEVLASEGIVVKKQGFGTIVQPRKIIQEAGRITSWTEEMALKEKSVETMDLEIYELLPSSKMIHSMKLETGEKIVCVKRIRCANNEPIAIMFNYLRSRYVPGFLENGLMAESLYQELETRYGILLEEADEIIQARIASDWECSALQIPPYSAVLQISRISYLQDGTPFEMVEMINRSDRYQYQIHLSGRNKKRG